MQTIFTKINYSVIKRLLDGSYDDITYSKYSRIYPFTNEPLDIYFDTMDFKNKSVLTVMSSGDHTLNAIAENPSSIDCFDINILTEYYYHFKKAAIQSFTYKEYMNFLTSLLAPPSTVFSPGYNQKEILNGYMILREQLNEEVKQFWDFFVIESNIDFNKRMNNLFYGCPIQHIETSITEEQYNKLQIALPNYNINNFFGVDIESLSQKLERRKYDYMLLSNIGDYIDCNKYYLILSTLINNLNDKGKIILFSFKNLKELQHEQTSCKHNLPFTIENYSLDRQDTMSIIRKRYR